MRQFGLSTILILNVFFTVAQTADFSYTSNSGLFCSPQVIKFTQNCTGNPVSFVWNFGNGKRGNHPVESVVYTNPGTYLVKLIAVYNNTAITVTKSIVINAEPSISLTANKRNLCRPGPVSFTVNGSASVTGYQWNFGDGSPVQTSTTNNITHNFNSYDTFNIAVKAITASGCNATARIIVKIAQFELSGTATPVEGCVPVDAVLKIIPHFLPGDGLQSLLWDFGDGSPATPVTPGSTTIHHTYNTTNIVSNANVIVTTNEGCTNQFTFDTLAFGLAPTATQAYTTSHRDTFCGSENIELYAQALGAEIYKWDYGDGSFDVTAENIIHHQFNSLGDKRVIVTPVLHGCEGEQDTLFVNIHGVIAKYDIANTCASKNSYFFSNHSFGNISHFQWTFADTPGLIDSTNLSAAHNFPVTGSFYADLLLIDNITGCHDSLRSNIYTAIPTLHTDKNSVCKDSLIGYRVNNDYPPNTGYTYEFHINDSVIDNGSVDTLSYHPMVHGNFNDYVVIKDRLQGTCNDSVYISQLIRVKGPEVDYTVPDHICFDSVVTITNNSYPYFANEPITTWYWDFDDSEIDSSRDPVPHQYQSTGTYNIKLTATDVNHCAQALEKQIVIDRLPHVDVLPRHDTICLNIPATLVAYSSDPVLWSTATGTICNSCDTITVIPAISTNYIATAINNTGCRNYDSSIVSVYGPLHAKVIPSDTSICPKTNVQLMVTPDGIITWSPANYLSDAHIKNPIAAPGSNMIYNIIIKDSVGCYADTLSATIFIREAPVVNAGPDLVLDYNTPFTLSPVYPSNIVNYLWTSTGDLDCYTCAVVHGTALQKESYTIEVSDEYGCRSADSITVSINCANSRLMMPGAFTPNGDGNNDYFYPIARGFDFVKNFSIFDREGTLVFERKNFNPNIASLGWNGISKTGKKLTTQTFIWMAELECDPQHSLVKKGTVLLIR